MIELLKWIAFSLCIYYLFSSLGMFAVMLFQFFRLRKLKKNYVSNFVMEKEACVPVSIVLSVMEDEQKLLKKMESLFALDYPSYEILMVYDGVNEMFLEHITKTYSLKQIQHPYRRQVETKAILGVYEGNMEHIHVTLVHKEKDGIGDAFNAGINLAKYPYLILLENSVRLNSSSIRNLLYLMIHKKDVVACGGMIDLDISTPTVLGKIQKLVYQRKQLLTFSKKPITQTDVKTVWMVKKEVALSVGGLAIESEDAIGDFMVKIYDYCWEKEMEDAILIVPNKMGFHEDYSTWGAYLDSDSSIVGKLCFHLFGLFFLFLAAFFSIFPTVELILFGCFYFFIEGFIFWFSVSFQK